MKVLALIRSAATALVALAVLAAPLAAQTAPVVAAAADLQFALEEIAAKFRSDTGGDVRLNFGSSGNFARQLQQGAPFEIFLSADEGFVFQLADAGKTLDRGVLYAEGRIVLFVPKGSSLRADAKLDDLRAGLADGRVQRFAIANPEHAPYGRAAEQVLKSQGLWDSVEPKLVLGENVSQLRSLPPLDRPKAESSLTRSRSRRRSARSVPTRCFLPTGTRRCVNAWC